MHEPFTNATWLKSPYGDVTQYYGENRKLYLESMKWHGGHNGVDLARPYGEHLFAVEDGMICDVKDDAGGYGKHIRILSEYTKGKYREWTYGHLSNIVVKLGQKVSEGQFVGQMGNSGFVVSGDTPYWAGGTNKYQGTHLHLNLRELIKDPNGWKYTWDMSPRVRCENYDNGTKGGIDPLPLFVTPKALKYAMLADKTNNQLYWQMASLLLKLKL